MEHLFNKWYKVTNKNPAHFQSNCYNKIFYLTKNSNEEILAEFVEKIKGLHTACGTVPNGHGWYLMSGTTDWLKDITEVNNSVTDSNKVYWDKVVNKAIYNKISTMEFKFKNRKKEFVDEF